MFAGMFKADISCMPLLISRKDVTIWAVIPGIYLHMMADMIENMEI